ncbi:hypothetical protein C8R47DRAFT_1073625 [Mycena vitilis]|nr:hypothetical protein C8R47DRAFT_1073625 [Mycena vitilis]
MAVLQSLSGPSLSTQIALLQRLLRPVEPSREWLEKVSNGEIPLAVEAHSADIIASLILLKQELEHAKGHKIQMTITGAAEAHSLAQELGAAGPPLTAHTSLSALMAHNVTVGVGVMEIWDAHNTRFDIAWQGDLVATRLPEFGSKVIAVLSTSRGLVNVL